MKRFFISILLLLITMQMFAQTNNPKPEGEYYLEGVREVGSGLKLNADKTFEFFYVYGALDRTAKGIWIQHGDSIILNNKKNLHRILSW
jgi:hypothetical protein